ncbi:MAG: hypothetical protein IDH49_08190 [Gammaproteobacteria bacterium]|nr:hypothetical protein [Gammaproteobacteria bacterium]
MAGRPAYQITKMDFAAAKKYLENAMERGDVSKAGGYMAFRRADTPELLQAWCDDYLQFDIFRKLKGAVLAARKRARDYKTPKTKVRIDLDYHAHMRLSSLAEELGATLSETVVLLEEVYWKARDAGILK